MISTSLLAGALFAAAEKLVEKGIVDPALEKGLGPLAKWLTSGYDRKKGEDELQKAFSEAISSVGAPIESEDLLSDWLKRMGLYRLQAVNNHRLRQLVAQTVIGFTDSTAPPPDELVVALRWPRSKITELSSLLSNLRQSLAKLHEWQPLIAYADSAAQKGELKQIVSHLADWNSLMVWAGDGKALKVVVEKMGLSQEDAAIIERRYREELVRELYWHNFRGIVQVKQDLRLPLSDIYLELSVLELFDKEEHEELQLRILELSQDERVQIEEKRSILHLTDLLSKEMRLVILGDPGTGKTISLRYIALMLSYGSEAINLGLNEPFIPILVRLADYARELDSRPALSLENYLIEYIQQSHSGSDRLNEFLRLSLEQGKCILLFDGLDEVATNPKGGKTSHGSVVNAVQKFSELRSNDTCSNHIVITSRIEGYWNNPLLGFTHIQLSPLRIPDEVEAFLIHWYSAHEQAHDRLIDQEQAELRAQDRVKELLPRILTTPSIRRLATNPLLLTILSLINENVGRLPNRRIKLYEIAAQTLIESWRQLQVGMPDNLIAEFGEDMIIRIMAPLAYWMHEKNPGGTLSYEEWRERLQSILVNDGFEREARDLTNRFLYHARFQTGLLTERSLNQFGFFHLTFEEYLAARQIARQREEERRRMLKLHWSDPRWQEVILLTAGQLGIAESKTDDVSAFIEDLLKMEPENEEGIGRPAILAGRALADIGVRSVTSQTRRWVEQALRNTAQNLDPDTHNPSDKNQIQILKRATASDLLDELGFTPDDIFKFHKVEDFWVGKYPVTNNQYQRFINSPDYLERELWIDFPMYDEEGNQMKDNWGNKGFEWIEWQDNYLPNIRMEKTHKMLPKYWDDPRLGILRRHAPVIGISWYEANAYCKWITRHWDDLEESKSNLPKPIIARLPTTKEWEKAAGGNIPKDRYAWDKPGNTTKSLIEILNNSNVRENKLSSTTQVWLYPTGGSPNGLMDMSGNIWEWQANFSHREHDYLALRGGSWNVNKELAQIGYKFYFHPFDRSSSVGFRLVIIPK